MPDQPILLFIIIALVFLIIYVQDLLGDSLK